jgi:OmpA-OmpF porin, OOP family
MKYNFKVKLVLSFLLIGLPVFKVAAQTATAKPAASVSVSDKKGPVVVSGIVADDATRQGILARVREVFTANQVVDQVGLEQVPSPANWSQIVQKIISKDLQLISRGQIKITGNSIELAGQVASDEIKQTIERQLKEKLNPTYVVKNGLVVTGAGQKMIDSAMANRIVEFESGNAKLTATGLKVLDELTPILMQFPTARFEVVGHTDSVGAREANLLLSEARAKTVRDYLVSKSIEVKRMDVLGVGPDRPAFSNDSAANRTKNRRIEFRLL